MGRLGMRLRGGALCAVVFVMSSVVLVGAPVAGAAGPTSLTGVVTDAATGEPVGGVEVDVVVGSSLEPGANVVASGTTDATGGYAFDLSGLATASDPVTVDLVDPSGTFGVSYANPVALVDDDTVFASFALDPGAAVSGTVSGQGAGPVAGSCVTVRNAATALVVPAGLPGSCSDATGAYALPALAAGTYTLTFSSPDPAVWNSIPAQQVTVAAGTPAVADAVLLPVRETSITGVVTELGTGTALAGMSVTASTTDAAGAPRTLTATTDATGAFTLAIGFQPGPDPFVVDVTDPTGAHHPARGITISVQAGYTEAIGVTLQPAGQVPAADLSITSPTRTVIVGQPTTLDFVAVNAGPTAAADVTATIALPDLLAVDGVEAPAGWTCVLDGRTVRCSIASLGVQRQAPIRVAVRGVGTVGFASLGVSIGGSTFDPVPANNQPFVFVSVQPDQVDVVTLLDARSIEVGVSSPISFGAYNLGPATAKDVFAILQLPPELTIDGIESPGWACAVDGQTVGCSIPALAVEQRIQAVVRVTAASMTTGLPVRSIVGTASLDLAGFNDLSDVTIDVGPVGSVDLSVSTERVLEPVISGRTTFVSIQVSNLGPAVARDVALTVDIPAGVSVESARDGIGVLTCEIAITTVTCSAPTMARDAFAIVQIAIRPVVPDVEVALPVRLTTSSPEIGPNPTTATIGPFTPVTASVDLGVQITASPQLVGSTGTVSVSMLNRGPASATDVDVTVDVPAGFVVESVTPSFFGGQCVIDGNVVRCRIPTFFVFPFALPIAEIRVRPLVGGSAEVTTSVSSPDADPDTTNNSASASLVAEVPQVDLTVQLSSFVLPQVGDEGSVFVSVSTFGSGSPTPVELVIDVPEPFVPTRVDQVGWSCVIEPHTVRCTASSVFFARSLVLTYLAEGTGPVTATATVSSPAFDPDLTNNSSAVELRALPLIADLTASPSVVGAAVPGEPVDISIFTQNNSLTPARNVVFSVTASGGRIEAVSASSFTCEVLPDGSGRCAASQFPGFTFIPFTVTVVPDDGPAQLSVEGTISSTATDPDPSNNTASLQIPLLPAGTADLGAQLLAGGNLFALGVPREIRIGATNFGPSVVSEAVATFSAGAEFDITSVQPDDGVSCATVGVVVTCRSSGLRRGTNMGAVITVTPTTTNPAGSFFSVAVSGATFDPAPFNDVTFAFAAVVLNESDLAVSLSGPTLAAVGGELVLTMEAVNRGPAPATDTVITIEVPPALEYVPSAGSLACTPAGPGRLTCPLGSFDPFSSVTPPLRFEAMAVTDAATLTVSVDSATPERSPFDNTASVQVTVGPANAADLEAGAPVARGAIAGVPTTYVVSARHLGPSSAAATGVRLVAVFPANVQVDRAQGLFAFQDAACTVAGPRVECAIDALPANSDFLVLVELTPLSPTPFTQVTVDVSSDVDPRPSNDSVTGAIEILPNESDLTVSTGGVTGVLDVGASESVAATVVNIGPAPSQGGVLRIEPSEGITVTTASMFNAAGPCVTDGTAWACPLDDLPQSIARSVFYTVTGTAAGPSTVTLRVVAANDGNRSNDAVAVAIEIVTPGTGDLYVNLSSFTVDTDGRQSVSVSFGQNGPTSSVPDVELRIDLPGLAPGAVSSFGADITCTPEPEALVCRSPQFARFTSGFLFFQTSVVRNTSGSEITATITGGGVDLEPSNDVARSVPYDTFITPAAPLGVVGFPGDRVVELRWGPPVFPTSGIVDYLVEYSRDGGVTWTRFADAGPAGFAATEALVDGLTNGVPYVFRVAAVSDLGQGDWSDVSAPVTPSLPPRAPTDLEARAGNARVTLTWRAPSQRGRNPIVDYVVEYSTDRGRTWLPYDDGVSTSTRVVVEGLTNGTRYTFRVAGLSDAGLGRFSEPSNAVTPRRR